MRPTGRRVLNNDIINYITLQYFLIPGNCDLIADGSFELATLGLDHNSTANRFQLIHTRSCFCKKKLNNQTTKF